MSQNNVIYRDTQPTTLSEITSLYESVGWTHYSHSPHTLMIALQNSTYVISSYENERLIGLIRGLSDGVSIHFIQDLLVRPEHTRTGIGRTLMKKALELYPHIQKHLLLTDNEAYQKIFYECLGFKNLDLIQPKLNVYIQLKDNKTLHK